MATEVAAQMGSGTVPFTKSILHTSLGGSLSVAPNAGPSDGRGIRRGSQVMIGNPEDLVSVPAFRASGVSVGTTPVRIMDQNIRDALLFRGTRVKIENLGPGDVYIGSTNGVSVAIGGLEPGWKLQDVATNIPPQSVELPIMNGVEVWAIASSGATDVRILLF